MSDNITPEQRAACTNANRAWHAYAIEASRVRAQLHEAEIAFHADDCSCSLECELLSMRRRMRARRALKRAA